MIDYFLFFSIKGFCEIQYKMIKRTEKNYGNQIVRKFIFSLRLVSSPSFILIHIFLLIQVFYYLSRHLSHIQYKFDLMFPFLIQNRYQSGMLNMFKIN
ncbi:hypothetical protein BpHYR1_029953 [Brachionus plicatilis]|uniref:Uncharacterized protein n=1 Tax=Brachionus plicatilis TaxID=10195 RepID=A0A3M7QC64_BRAPC|nr:hypothetical protein BpHYR1_029953 [Brachionus plicatilis]